MSTPAGQEILLVSSACNRKLFLLAKIARDLQGIRTFSLLINEPLSSPGVENVFFRLCDSKYVVEYGFRPSIVELFEASMFMHGRSSSSASTVVSPVVGNRDSASSGALGLPSLYCTWKSNSESRSRHPMRRPEGSITVRSQPKLEYQVCTMHRSTKKEIPMVVRARTTARHSRSEVD